MSNNETWVIPEDEPTQRLDKYLVEEFPEYSRSFLQNAIKDGLITLKRNGTDFDKNLKPSEKVEAGDEISFEIPEVENFELAAEDFDLPIIYEDEHMLVINKPAGLVVHPGAGNHDNTLVNKLLGYNETAFRAMTDEEARPGIVHRLDKETSGVILVAKNKLVKEKLSAAFAGRNVEKYYLVLVRGKTKHNHGTIQNYIGRDKKDRIKMAITHDEEHGKHAISHYRVMGANGQASFVKVKIETGRTHQIRVHMAGLGNPVIGDKLYSERRVELNQCPERHLLHAWKVRMIHPITQEPMEFVADLTDDFKDKLEKFKIKLK